MGRFKALNAAKFTGALGRANEIELITGLQRPVRLHRGNEPKPIGRGRPTGVVRENGMGDQRSRRISTLRIHSGNNTVAEQHLKYRIHSHAE